MDPSARPLSERERFRLAVLLAAVPDLPPDWADRVWDRWDADPWALLEQLRRPVLLGVRANLTP